MEIKYHIVSMSEIILSNISTKKIDEISDKEEFYTFDKEKGIREVKKFYNDGWIYLSIKNKNITKKIFNHYIDIIIAFYSPLKNNHSVIEDKYNSKIKRLKHNITNYSATIQSELENIIDSNRKNIDWKSSIEEIKNFINDDSDFAAKTLFRIFKNIKLINAEMEVYDIMNSEKVNLNILEHNVRKVIDLSIQPFFLDFLDKKISIKIDNTTEKVLADFSTLSVVLGHVFDNAVKYIAPDTELKITFSNTDEKLTLIISMISIYVENDEIEEIFKEQYSGRWAEEMGLSGYGIGMFYAKKLMKINDGDIRFIAGNEDYKINGIPYAKNKIEITLIKRK